MGSLKEYILTGDDNYLDKYHEEFNSYLSERSLFVLIKELNELGKSISLKKEGGSTYCYILEDNYFSPEISKEVNSIRDINLFIGKYIYNERGN